MKNEIKNLIETYLKNLGYSDIKWETNREGFYLTAKSPLKRFTIIEPERVWEEIYWRYMI